MRRATTGCGHRPATLLYFYPRSPCGERQCGSVLVCQPEIFLSTLSLRRATRIRRQRAAGLPKFLSTLSLRRATSELFLCFWNNGHFYPRSPCGERLRVLPFAAPTQEISIHALLAESDHVPRQNPVQVVVFLSTLSLRRATIKAGRRYILIEHFYPRSPCGERPRVPRLSSSPHNFYPRSPCGERLELADYITLDCEFLSTLSLRRATTLARAFTPNFSFLSTLSLRRATTNLADTIVDQDISIHALLAESDGRSGSGGGIDDISIHALLAESD